MGIRDRRGELGREGGVRGRYWEDVSRGGCSLQCGQCHVQGMEMEKGLGRTLNCVGRVEHFVNE